MGFILQHSPTPPAEVIDADKHVIVETTARSNQISMENLAANGNVFHNSDPPKAPPPPSPVPLDKYRNLWYLVY
jgi:hypothetical protein